MCRLFSPLKIKNMELKNRIVLPPMCMKMAEDGFVNDFHIIHYTARAIGQMGLIIVEAAAVMDNGQITKEDLGIWNDKFVPKLKELVDSVHAYDAKIGIQISHAGRKARDTNNMIAPSALSYGDYKTPREMTVKEIKEVVKAFGLAAKRAEEAGFDFLEIHAAHGYLINQFLSPISNERIDEYGGTFKNRKKILHEIVEEIRKYWPKEKPLGVRFSATEYEEKGLNLSDILAIIYCNEKDIDVINVTTGGITTATYETYPGYQLNYAKEIKNKTDKVIVAGGLITTSELAGMILNENTADLVYFGRLALKEPYFPLRFAKELAVDIKWPEFYERAK